MTEQLIDQLLTEIKKDETQEKIKCGVVDPLIQYLHSKVYNYLQFLGVLMGLMILLLLLILYYVWSRNSE
jgi:uncharacterized protein involved in cysteine biosynthesis